MGTQCCSNRSEVSRPEIGGRLAPLPCWLLSALSGDDIDGTATVAQVTLRYSTVIGTFSRHVLLEPVHLELT